MAGPVMEKEDLAATHAATPAGVILRYGFDGQSLRGPRGIIIILKRSSSKTFIIPQLRNSHDHARESRGSRSFHTYKKSCQKSGVPFLASSCRKALERTCGKSPQAVGKAFFFSFYT